MFQLARGNGTSECFPNLGETLDGNKKLGKDLAPNSMPRGMKLS